MKTSILKLSSIVKSSFHPCDGHMVSLRLSRMVHTDSVKQTSLGAIFYIKTWGSGIAQHGNKTVLTFIHLKMLAEHQNSVHSVF